MGMRFEAKCLDCGNTFMLDDGGGWVFHLVRCNECGGTKEVYFEELGDLHLRYLKGLRAPYSTMSAEFDKYVREHAPVEPISEEEYYRGIDTVAGKCSCGGDYSLDAPPRCPKCRSTRVEKGRIDCCYD